MSISVVIRALNEGQHLGRLLRGLQQQSVVPDEIILVDSGSTDDTVAIAEQWGAKIVHIAKSDFSFGRSLNRGCEAATGDLLLIVSAHVYPVFDTYVEHLAEPFENERTAIAYGRQVGDHRTKFSESRVMLKWFPEESIWEQGNPFSNNANAMVRRSVWDEFRYDEELTGLEDLAFAKRAQEEGYSVSYVADAPVVHVHEETWQTVRNRYRREAIAYSRIMGPNRMSPFRAVSLGLANTVTDYVHAAREGKLFSNLAGIPSFRAAQFIGTYEGLSDRGSVSDELRRRFYYPNELTNRVKAAEPGQRIRYDQDEV